MPVPLIYRFSRAITFDNKPIVYLVAAGLILLAIRVWSSSSSLRVRRVLHGKTIVISGGLTPLNLSLLRSLAEQGAQCVLLHPDPASPLVQQFLSLITSTTENELVYAETVDCSGTGASLASIQNFCKYWVTTKRKSPIGGDLGNQSIDSLILSDDESLSVKSASRDPRESYHFALLRAKIALVKGLQPVLKSSNTRIINVVSPFYAASPPIPMPSATENASPFQRIPWRQSQPWTHGAAPALASVALFRHLAMPPDDLTSLSVSTGMTRSWIGDTLAARFGPLGWLVVLLASPLIWAFGKSMNEATTEVERAIHLDLKQLRQADRKAINALINAGTVVSLRRSELTDPAFGEHMYKYEATGIVASVARHAAESGSADARKDR